jgi:hypothetical protein
MVSYGTSHRSQEYLTKIGYQGDMKFGYCWFNYKKIWGIKLNYYPGKFSLMGEKNPKHPPYEGKKD